MTSKLALVIANTEYQDASFAKLTAPGKDAEGLALVLRSKEVAAFDDVQVLINEGEGKTRRFIARFFADRKPSDLLLLYFSGHGVRNEQGQLFLATSDTEISILEATGIPAEFITRTMNSSRSQRQLLILDCCNSGAFAHGSKSTSGVGTSMGIASAFEGNGYGRVVLTATDATQYAWEGNKAIGDTEKSVFTHFLIEGLKGEADRNGDGRIDVDELYDYTYEQVVKRTPKQTPGKWSYKQQGNIILRDNLIIPAEKETPLPTDLLFLLTHPSSLVRSTGMQELIRLLNGEHPGLAHAAQKKLHEIFTTDDSLALRKTANEILVEHGFRQEKPVSLELPQDELKEELPSESDPTIPEGSTLQQSEARTSPHEQTSLYRGKVDTSKLLEDLILAQSAEYVTKGYNIELLRRGLKKATEVVWEKLRKMSVMIDTKEELASVAAHACSDEEIGNLIADVMDKVGKDGVITVEESQARQFEIEYVEGMQFDRGYLSGSFITDTDRMEAVVNDPYILLHDKRISSAQDIVPILEKLVQIGRRDLVIIAEDIDGEALATLVLNKTRGMLNVLAVKAPGFGDRRKAMLQDIAILTGGTVISEETGRKLETAILQDLGRAEKVISDQDDTTIVEGKGTQSGILGRIKEIRSEIEKSTSDYDREKLYERLAKISGGVAIIRVAGLTENELKEKKRLVEDALYAARLAVQEGIVPGNGIAYLNCIEALDRFKPNLEYEKIGISILRNILDAPVKRLAVGAGLDSTIVLSNILRLSKERKNANIGYDIFTEEYKDMIEAGIMEPVKKVMLSLEKAVDSAIERMTNP